MKVDITCEWCGKVWPVYPSWANKRFCSRACCSAWKKSVRFGSERMTGPNNPMWRGGESDKDRRNADYKDWRISVFKRDGFICQDCGYFNGCGDKRRDINAHHIVPWVDSKELRYEVDNGETLCVPCHIKRHKAMPWLRADHSPKSD
jgi:hypothetical protein